MRFTKISIKNFRALTDIEATLKPRCNVVVGPNAIGKTTFLDAIRLAKGLLAPRSQNEPNQILFALGALNPQIPNSLISSAIASDSNLPLLINCNIQFSSSEIALLEEPTSAVAIATQMLLASMGQQFRSQTDLIGLLSSSQGGQGLEMHGKQIREAISDIKSGKLEPRLHLRIDLNTGQSTTEDSISPALVAFLDRRLALYQTIFSYFPADRAIPTQDQPVMIGPGDAGNQIETHNSQPQRKRDVLAVLIGVAVL